MYAELIIKRANVGIIENPRKAATNFVLRREPKTFLRLSMRSFPRFLKISQNSPVRIKRFKFKIPKKKIEVAKGSESEIFERRSSVKVREIKRIERKTISPLSLFRFLTSSGFNGVSLLYFLLEDRLERRFLISEN